ncbi:MAG: creatininase family protein [Woeseiaceae bacterium]|nr:creatininase family protein [Woeseiaceae bacterium]
MASASINSLLRLGITAALVMGCGNAVPQVGPLSDKERQQRIQAMLAAPNPLEAVDSVWMENLTWVEVRDRIRDGHTTVIVSTGGLEENGPYLTTGKHNVILKALCPAIARELGNALCAPVVPFVPGKCTRCEWTSEKLLSVCGSIVPPARSRTSVARMK